MVAAANGGFVMTGTGPVLVDERDTSWEAEYAAFRIIIFEGVTTVAYDYYGTLADAGLWAHDAAKGDSYRVGLLANRRGEKGIYWLVIEGDDPNQSE